MSNKSIKALQKQLERLAAESDATRTDLQTAYDAVFNDSGVLRDMISKAEASTEYGIDEHSEVYQWARVDLGPFTDAREYLDAWFSDQGYRADWDNDALVMGQGENFHIQDDARHRSDNGVWLAGFGGAKLVIPETAYRRDGEDPDEEQRNALIELEMKRTGYFPGTYRVDQYANVSYVDTRPKCTAAPCNGRLLDHGAEVYACDTCKAPGKPYVWPDVADEDGES